MIPPTRIYLPQEDKDWILEKIREILDSAILTEGRFCKELETRLAEYLGSKNVVVTNSGTGALESMIRATSVEGDIVVTTETFSATIYAILRAGCRPVFADVGSDMALSLEAVKQSITEKTKAVMTVHIGGLISDSVREIKEFCEKKDLMFFEDAAQVMGSKYGGVSPGKFGASAGFSLFPTKVMASAEGGFVSTENTQIADKVRILKDQGKVRGNYCSVQGYNWRMSEIQAVIALSQLRRLEQFIQARSNVAEVYDESFQERRFGDSIARVTKSEFCRSNWYKYLVFLKGINKENLRDELKKKGFSLGGDVYEVPCHLQDAFKELGYRKGDFPVAEEVCSSHVSFPILSNMTDNDALQFLEALGSSLTLV